MKIRCANCFAEYEEELGLCPVCGYVEGDPVKEPYVLQRGMVLNGRYRVGAVIGIGGFGITYKAWDEKLDVVVAIKEYYPSGLVNRNPGTKEVKLYAVNRKNIFDHGLTRFLDEARNMAKFNSHKNIVNVYEYFEENGTAYIAMEYLDGSSLDTYLENNSVTLEESLRIIFDVGSALKEIHSKGIIHRDVSPDNIFICKNNVVKLLDFGAARFSADEDKQLTIILKPGFAPAEQYEKVNKQGPWTDVYALGATLYLMLTGEKPEESTNRKMNDTLASPHEVNSDIPEYISNSVMKAMAVEVHMRFQTIDEFEDGLNQKKKVVDLKVEKKRRKRRRNLGVIAAVAVVAAGAAYFFTNWNEQREEETLPEANITMWYPLTGDETLDEARYEAYTLIIEEFTESFPEVTVDINTFEAEEYETALEEALASDSMPNLFVSEGVSESVLEKAADVSSVAKSNDANGCYFFEDYDKYFSDKKQIPVGFTVQAVYVNTTLAEISETETITAEQILALGDETVDDGVESYAVLSSVEASYTALLGEDIISGITATKEDFYSGSALCFLANTTVFRQVQANLPARYEMLSIDADSVQGEFTTLWSMFSTSKNEDKASKRLLQYFLCDHAQDYLHLQNTSDELPINKNTLEELEEVYGDYAGFFANIDKVTF